MSIAEGKRLMLNTTIQINDLDGNALKQTLITTIKSITNHNNERNDPEFLDVMPC